MKRIDLKFKIIIMFLLLFLMCPLSVSAGRNDQMKEDPNKNIINDEASAPSIKQRLQEYCSFWSDSEAFGSAYSALAQPDENSINGYAKLLDTTTGGRGAVRELTERD